MSNRPGLDPKTIASVSVLGAGTMGHGIAEVAALAGYKVVLYDVEPRFLDSGIEKVRWSLNKLAEKGAISAKKAGRRRQESCARPT